MCVKIYVMRKIAFLLVLMVATSSVYAQKINWLSLEEALKAQEKNPKKIMMDVYTNWCGPCKYLDKTTFQNEDLANFVNEHYYAVKFNAEGDDAFTYKGQPYANPDYNPSASGRNSVHEFASAMGITAYPTIVFLDETGNFLVPIKGYQNANQLELYLKLFYQDAYKEVNTKELWEKFQQDFKPEFKVAQQ